MENEEAVIQDFHALWMKRKVVFHGRFLGIPTLQNPLDFWITQEIVSEIKPDVILECGSLRGGSALLWAWLLQMVNPNGRVISVDIVSSIDERVPEFAIAKKHVEFIKGSSVDPEIVSKVAERVHGKKVMVILDSDHSKEHVLKELRAYAPMVALGSYAIVQDVPAGPGRAIREFLAEDKRFEPDRSRERYMITNCRGGFLKRIHP